MAFALKQLSMIAALACCAGGVSGVSAYAGKAAAATAEFTTGGATARQGLHAAPDSGKAVSTDTASVARTAHKGSPVSKLLSGSIYLGGLPTGWKYSLTPGVPAGDNGPDSVLRLPARTVAQTSTRSDDREGGAGGFSMLPNFRLYPYLGTGYRYGQYNDCLGPGSVMAPDSSSSNRGYNPNCGSVWYTGANAGYSVSKRLALNIGAGYTQVGNGEGAVQTISSWLFQSQPTGQASWTTFRAGLEYHF